MKFVRCQQLELSPQILTMKMDTRFYFKIVAAIPIPSGLMDQRLGTIEPGQRCQTCGNLVSNCMGHFGHSIG
ncbi:MAG: hypothetical protein EU529_17150 [Promethearchaeota archaeon]|nr:MAG: hypothetical protein EU529_17150 [Candidatus Lokiarchaeota archaeon]